MSYRASGLWKSILSVKMDFNKCIRFRVNNGQQVKFCDDLGCGGSSLKDQFCNTLNPAGPQDLDIHQFNHICQIYQST